jgi:dCTP deaminase
MSFWSTEKLEEKQKQKNLITPYRRQHLQHAAYELSLGTEAFITSDGVQTKRALSVGEQIEIPPGQFALLITSEIVRVPNDAIGLISIKASIKFLGLINISGFHVDPGFTGRLKFSVYNAGSRSILLACGDPVFLIWFSSLDRFTEDAYNGVHANQEEISCKDVMDIKGEIASPAALLKKIHDLREDHGRDIATIRKTVDFWKTVIIGISITVIGGIIAAVVAGIILSGAFRSIERPATPSRATIETANPTEGAPAGGGSERNANGNRAPASPAHAGTNPGSGER